VSTTRNASTRCTIHAAPARPPGSAIYPAHAGAPPPHRRLATGENGQARVHGERKIRRLRMRNVIGAIRHFRNISATTMPGLSYS
ncbi:hypothetical protein, partial [Xanthomonas translucens]|uniref:hypothetical protein n=1 Tax=Xanthomonas campestris pv. translucens TaxID=343 RepID=UPI001E431621